MSGAHDPTETYISVDDGGAMTAVPVTADFWPDLMAGKRTVGERLMTGFDVTGDMDHWERHPAGEEMFISVSATVDVTCWHGPEPGEGDRTDIRLEPGQVAIVPRNCWHRFFARRPGRLLVMTWGAGTDHRHDGD